LTWGQTTIAVFDFSNNGLKDNEVKTLTDRLRNELVQNGNFKVVERSKIDEILSEQKFQMSGCVDECLIEVGKILGASKIVIGSIGMVGNTYTISARMVDAETGEIENAFSYDSKYNIDLLLTNGMKEVALRLIDPKANNIISSTNIKTTQPQVKKATQDNPKMKTDYSTSKNTTVLKQYYNQKSHNYGLFIGGIATENRGAINSNIRIYKNLGMGIIISGNNMTSGHSVTNYLPYISIEPKNYSEIWSSSFLLGLTYTQIDLQSKGIDFLYDNSLFIAYSLNLRIGLIGMSFLAGVIENLYINDKIDGTSEISNTSYEFFPGLSFNIYLY
tara:strand:- start:347 stop:1339 length:993 start_codon:yes stop_codon:yes gene_type:complete